MQKRIIARVKLIFWLLLIIGSLVVILLSPLSSLAKIVAVGIGIVVLITFGFIKFHMSKRRKSIGEPVD